MAESSTFVEDFEGESPDFAGVYKRLKELEESWDSVSGQVWEVRCDGYSRYSVTWVCQNREK